MDTQHPELLTAHQAVDYQLDRYGHVAFSRDSLYQIARAGKHRVVKNGKRKLFFPRSTIDALLSGEISQDGAK